MRWGRCKVFVVKMIFHVQCFSLIGCSTHGWSLVLTVSKYHFGTINLHCKLESWEQQLGFPLDQSSSRNKFIISEANICHMHYSSWFHFFLLYQTTHSCRILPSCRTHLRKRCKHSGWTTEPTRKTELAELWYLDRLPTGINTKAAIQLFRLPAIYHHAISGLLLWIQHPAFP